MDASLAKPRGFCAGVIRAVDIVEKALDIYGPPVYVLHEIVHNQRVLGDLRKRGAVFTEDISEIPEGALLIFSAHGVAKNMYDAARLQKLRVVDATCPLVTKVHVEAAHHAREGREVILIGHAGHAEVNGTLGQYDHGGGGAIYLVQDEDDARTIAVRDPGNLAYITQTTLSVDDSRRIVDILKDRFPKITGPRKSDICYATQNRQNAVFELAQEVEILLIVGARNSSNSNRLREVGEQNGCIAHLVQDATELRPEWFRPGMKVGISAGASTPEVLVMEILIRLNELGLRHVTEVDAASENVVFPLPSSLTSYAEELRAGSASPRLRIHSETA